MNNGEMHRDARVYIAGHRGLVGSALVRRLERAGYQNLMLRTHEELDLTDQKAVAEFFSSQCPDYVFLAAARVGGIMANSIYPAEFIQQNLSIQTNVIHEAWKAKVKRLLFLGSSCIYPRDCPQPMREDDLLSGPLEATNRAYALAKIAGIEMCCAYNQQYGTRFLAVMPANVYGPSDNFNLETSHVLPALIRKMHEAKIRGDTEMIAWGTGTPKREFLYSDDLADASVFLMELSENGSVPINIGCGKEISIKDLAELVRKIVGFKGKIAWDKDKPDGSPQKLLDTSRLVKMGWKYTFSLTSGIQHTYKHFVESMEFPQSAQRFSADLDRAQATQGTVEDI